MVSHLIAFGDVEIASLTPSLCNPVSRMIAEVIADVPYYSAAAREAEIAKYTSQKLHDLIHADAHSVLVATADKELAGFCVSTYDDGLIWVAWFGVRKAHRGKGIASRILNATIDLVRPRGCHKIWCDTRTSNVESRSVLLRAGFRQVCLLERHWYEHDFWLWERVV